MNLTANEKNAAAARQRRYVLLLAVMLVLLFIIIVLSFWVGYYPLTPVQVLNAFLSKFGFKGDILPQAVTIFWNIRLPRILSALFIGASLSVAGATYQGMFRNPLVSPDILGVSSGASLGAAFAILNGASNWMIQLSAFAGGVAAVAASYLISRKSAHSQTLSLVLTGTMIMSLCNAGVTMIKYVADPNDVLQQITFWLMGSLTKTTTKSFSWSVLPMIIGRTLQEKDLVVVLVKLPISQKVICWRTSLGSATYLIIVTPALQSDMIIVPVRTRLRVWECADFRLIR